MQPENTEIWFLVCIDQQYFKDYSWRPISHMFCVCLSRNNFPDQQVAIVCICHSNREREGLGLRCINCCYDRAVFASHFHTTHGRELEWLLKNKKNFLTWVICLLSLLTPIRAISLTNGLRCRFNIVSPPKSCQLMATAQDTLKTLTNSTTLSDGRLSG